MALEDRWKRILDARKVLGLPEEVTRLEIQKAYRKMCRKIHPDGQEGEESEVQMARLNEAYRILMDYTDRYAIKLTPNEAGMTEEEWWLYHFGQDPVWTSNKEKE